MKQVKILSPLLIASFFFLSCSHSKNKELTVPKDAFAVIHINGASLISKASWKDLEQTDWFRKQKLTVTDTYDKQLMDDPEKSGIDLKSDFIYFTQKKDFTAVYSVFEGKLKSAADFEKLLTQKNPGKKIEKTDDFSFLQTGNAELVSWTGTKFIYINTENSSGNKAFVTLDSLKAYAAFLYDLKKENSMESNEKYADLLKESGDIHFWSSTPDALSEVELGPVPVIAASALMQGSATAGTVNFENGKIVLKSKQFFNSTLSGIIEKYKAKPLTDEVLSHVVPNSSIVIAMNYHPQLIKDILRASGTESSANKVFDDFNFTMDDLLRSSRGEIVITASELTPKNPLMEEEMDDDDIFPFGGNLLLSLSLNNDSTFKKVQGIIKQQFPNVVTRIQNNWFFAGNSAETIDRFFGPGDNTIAGKIGGHPFGMFLDIQKGLQQWNVEGLDSSLIRQIEISKNFWQDITSTGGDFKSGSLQFETTINLVDKTTNSLKQLGKYSTQMAAFADKEDYVTNRLFPKKTLLAYKFY
jgi:hypothetical protein